MRVAEVMLCIWILWTGTAVWPQEASSAAHIEALIKQLGTGDVKVEDAAKLELMQHPSPDGILGAYKDLRKIPALLAHWADPNESDKVEAQVLELGKPVIPMLVQSLPDGCGGTTEESYAAWIGRLLGFLDQEGQRALLSSLASGEGCRLVAGRSGLDTPRPGPPMGPPPTEESDTEDAGRFLLVDAAGHENPIIRGSALAWIRALEGHGWPASENSEWPYFAYSSFLEALIKTYQSDADAETKTEIARMLARYPCVRVNRFMRAAVHSPSESVRTIGRKYLQLSSKTQ